MISLVGEQPMPVLLPILREQPPVAVLAHTERTRRVAENVKRVVEIRGDLAARMSVQLCGVDPYDVGRVRQAILEHMREQGWNEDQVLYNLTGGTKTMILAAYELARNASAPYCYLESEKGQSVLYRYEVHEGWSTLQGVSTPLGGLLTIDDYLYAHGFFNFRDSLEDKSAFFATVWGEVVALQGTGVLHEARPSVNLYGSGLVDVDMVVRFENQVAVAEVKSGNNVNSLKWIKQLNTAARPTTLGTYTKRFGIVDRQPQTQYREIAELQGIQVVVLDKSGGSTGLSDGDRETLRAAILSAFGRTGL